MAEPTKNPAELLKNAAAMRETALVAGVVSELDSIASRTDSKPEFLRRAGAKLLIAKGKVSGAVLDAAVGPLDEFWQGRSDARANRLRVIVTPSEAVPKPVVDPVIDAVAEAPPEPAPEPEIRSGARMIRTAYLDFMMGLHTPFGDYRLALYPEAIADAETYFSVGECVGGGYPVGGVPLTGYRAKMIGREAVLSFDDAVMNNVSVRARNGLLYNATNQKAIAVIELGRVFAVDGGVFVLKMPADGLVAIGDRNDA
jgi:hypothetical protein